MQLQLKWTWLCNLAVVCWLAAAGTMTAADKLAIAEPVARGGVKAEEVEAFWGMLEASAGGGYELISRSALKPMLTEIGLTASSDLVELNSTQKAKLGQLKTVRYLLVPTIAKFGSRYQVTMLVVDASTGEIDPEKRISESVQSLDELADKLRDMLREAGLGAAVRKYGRSAVLLPRLKTQPAPDYLKSDFGVRLEAALLAGGVKLQNLQSIEPILKKNKIGALNEAEPALYSRVGELLRVDYLIMPTISRFSCTVSREYIAVTRREVVHRVGNLDGDVRIVAAATGEVVASIPFWQKMDFDDLTDTDDWSQEDYGKYLIETAVRQIGQSLLPRVK